jgi:hypothetical protein
VPVLRLPRLDITGLHSALMRDLAERDADTAPFRNRLAELRAVHARKPSLIERINLAGLDA